jgi:succinoglycan biosynthesis transport protein ExoP
MQASTLSDYVAILSRRKAIVLLSLALVPLAALVVSTLQEPLYEAEAEVLLNRQSLANTLAGTTDPAIFQDAERVVQTQAELASTPAVAAATVASVRSAGLTAAELLRTSSIEPRPNVDLLEFTVRHEDATIASRLAGAYAREYTQYRTRVETQALVRARNDVRRRIAELRAAGTTGAVLDDLLGKEQQLLTLETLQTGNATVVRGSGEAEQVRPQPARNVALGLVLGLGLGLLLAFVADAVDTRIRSSDDVADALGLPLLGKLPPPGRAWRRIPQPEMLVESESPTAEAFRMLRTNIEFANLDLGAKTIVVTSAVEGEGKSTTVANLAVAYALSGKRVALVDLDLRRPSIRQFFELGRGAGITDVVLGRVPLNKALAPVPVDGLRVLQAGTLPPNPGEFVGSPAVGALLAGLAQHADVVLVDTPPLLQVGDAMTLTAAADAVIAVTRLKTLRRGMLGELRRALEQMPARVLGFVVTDAEDGTGYGYGYGYGRRKRDRVVDLLGRREGDRTERPAAPRRAKARSL